MASARRRALPLRSRRQRDGDSVRTRRGERVRLSPHQQLSRDPRLQLLEFLRDVGRTAGGRDCSAIDRRRLPQPQRSRSASMSKPVLIIAAASALLATTATATAPQFETPAKVAYLVDVSSGATLYAKNA